MKETRILLASVLKPINDSRMFRKLGLSLAKLPHTQIHISGYTAPVPPAPANIHFHPLFRFKRLGLGRFLAPWVSFKLWWRIAPQVLIVGTHELLLAALVYKLIRPCRIIYDIQENYYLNLTTQGAYSPLLSRLLANTICLMERFSAPFLDYFFLAESSYAAELPFIQKKYLVLENKYQADSEGINFTGPIPGRQLPPDNIHLLYSGTISELYGVFRAINLVNDMNRVAPIFKLTIIGYCPQPAELAKLKACITGKPAIKLIGGDYLVPHSEILAAIQTSHLGLLPYLPHPSTFNCIPTKLFEYLGNSLPVLIQQNPLWETYIEKYNAGLAIDFGKIHALAIYEALCSQIFYQNTTLRDVFWQSEEEKVLSWFKTMLPV